MVFVRPPNPPERHQTLDAQGFEALARFLLIFLESRSFRDSELTSLIHAIFSYEKIAWPFFFFFVLL
jgi:hypothetical protein